MSRFIINVHIGLLRFFQLPLIPFVAVGMLALLGFDAIQAVIRKLKE